MAAISNLSSASSAGPIQGVTDAKPSVALHDKLARCVHQLGDWKACASSKTPEGTQIIQDLQTQIRNIESRIASAGKGAAPQPANASQAKEPDRIGRLLDVFA